MYKINFNDIGNMFLIAFIWDAINIFDTMKIILFGFFDEQTNSSIRKLL